MALDAVCSAIAPIVLFIRPILVEVCGNNAIDTRWQLDGFPGHGEASMVLDAGCILYFDTRYGFGGYDAVLFSRILGS